MAFVEAAKLFDVPPGRVKTVEIGDEDIALCNVEGEIYAIANVCTHDGGPLGEGYLLGDEIECPRHGARFNVKTGEVKVLPAIVPVPTFKVKVEADRILVDVD
ncbi:MAG: Rieske (2Fe-2S) protein [Anaerolineae bacterium]|jgi:3-phenylpropionate/trans-cinnamate dioxygenase ferredoxin subunit